MTNTYRLAGRVVEIGSTYGEVHDLCRDYRCSGTPEYSVKVVRSDIDYERERSASTDVHEGRPVVDYTDSYLETLAVYRKVADRLIDYGTILFHGSAVAVDGVGYLFTAKSGTGKSTHTRLWREYFGERATVVNDDKPLIHVGGGVATVYGTPWDGKHRLSTNVSVPLAAICILTRSEGNHIEQVTKSDAYATLVQQTHRPADPLRLAKTLELIDRLTESVRLYRLGCNVDVRAAEVAYYGMKG